MLKLGTYMSTYVGAPSLAIQTNVILIGVTLQHYIIPTHKNRIR